VALFSAVGWTIVAVTDFLDPDENPRIRLLALSWHLWRRNGHAIMELVNLPDTNLDMLERVFLPDRKDLHASMKDIQALYGRKCIWLMPKERRKRLEARILKPAREKRRRSLPLLKEAIARAIERGGVYPDVPGPLWLVKNTVITQEPNWVRNGLAWVRRRLGRWTALNMARKWPRLRPVYNIPIGDKVPAKDWWFSYLQLYPNDQGKLTLITRNLVTLFRLEKGRLEKRPWRERLRVSRPLYILPCYALKTKMRKEAREYNFPHENVAALFAYPFDFWPLPPNHYWRTWDRNCIIDLSICMACNFSGREVRAIWGEYSNAHERCIKLVFEREARKRGLAPFLKTKVGKGKEAWWYTGLGGKTVISEDGVVENHYYADYVCKDDVLNPQRDRRCRRWRPEDMRILPKELWNGGVFVWYDPNSLRWVKLKETVDWCRREYSRRTWGFDLLDPKEVVVEKSVFRQQPLSRCYYTYWGFPQHRGEREIVFK
jgi:hypothetical protein